MRPTADDWYAARTIFRHVSLRPRRRQKHVYEERIVLLRAASETQAIQKAERDAAKYADAHAGVEYVGFVETFRLVESRIRSGSEVFSLMRSSSLSAPRFLSRYFADGSEHRRK